MPVHYLLDLFYPRICAGCKTPLLQSEHLLCTSCHFHLPHTYYHMYDDNPVAKLFWGRVPLQAAAAFLQFRKGGRTQHILHAIKYQQAQELGELMGKLYATQLSEHTVFSTADVIMPVPLHRSRERQRGYNQSLLFARGLAEELKKDVSSTHLLRVTATETQTRKSRFARFMNMQEVFTVAQPHELNGKHVLLVDDVVTTGSTLESCAQLLIDQTGCRVSVATIAAAL
jgi:ComF family protein